MSFEKLVEQGERFGKSILERQFLSLVEIGVGLFETPLLLVLRFLKRLEIKESLLCTLEISRDAECIAKAVVSGGDLGKESHGLLEVGEGFICFA